MTWPYYSWCWLLSSHQCTCHHRLSWHTRARWKELWYLFVSRYILTFQCVCRRPRGTSGSRFALSGRHRDRYGNLDSCESIAEPADQAVYIGSNSPTTAGPMSSSNSSVGPRSLNKEQAAKRLGELHHQFKTKSLASASQQAPMVPLEPVYVLIVFFLSFLPGSCPSFLRDRITLCDVPLA